MPLKPLFHRIRQIHRLSAEVNPGQAVLTFEVLDDVSVIGGVADFGDAEKADQLLFRHYTGAETNSAIGTP